MGWTTGREERKSARDIGLGVIEPGIPGEVKRDFTGEVDPRTVMEEPVDCLGRVMGVTKLDWAPEAVRARKWVFVGSCGDGFGGGVIFSILERGTKIPEVDVVVVKYFTPATLPSFLPWNSGCKSNPTNVPCLPFTDPTNL